MSLSTDDTQPIQTTKRDDSQRPSFYERLLATPMPPPGPSLYEARRKLWLTPLPGSSPISQPSSMQLRLQEVLGSEDAVHRDDVWRAGIEKVWKGLMAGGRFKKRLPMGLVMKVIHAGWLRDPVTWPPGAIPPEPDDVLEAPLPPPTTMTLVTEGSWTAISAHDPSSGTTSPWTAVCVPGGEACAEERQPPIAVA